MISVAITGFFTAFSLILAIGAQNVFVLRQGLLKQHVFALCLLCALSDAILITLGVAGFGYIVTIIPVFPLVMAWLGSAFLIVYGFLRMKAAWKGEYDLEPDAQSSGFARAILTGLALTWLNPHVYLDTLGLIGAVSTQYPLTSQKIVFGLAAVSASFTFFFSLGYGARILAPIMKTATAWRILDALIAVVMWVIAAGLVSSVI